MKIIKMLCITIISMYFSTSYANEGIKRERINFLSEKISFLLPEGFEERGENNYINYNKNLILFLFVANEAEQKNGIDILCENRNKECIEKTVHVMLKKSNHKVMNEEWIVINDFNILKLALTDEDDKYSSSLVFMTKDQVSVITLNSYNDNIFTPINRASCAQAIIDSIIVN